MSYTPNDHLHNFACWTAAAAVRRGFTTNKVIADAIEASNLQSTADDYKISAGDYQQIHVTLCNSLLTYFKGIADNVELEKGKSFRDKLTFGRMAKIVAIYMKTYVVIPNLNGLELKNIVDSIYPPIDQMLLDGLIEKNPTLKPKLKNYKWTKASEEEYNDLKNILIEKGLKFDWTLEEYWKGYREGEE